MKKEREMQSIYPFNSSALNEEETIKTIFEREVYKDINGPAWPYAGFGAGKRGHKRARDAFPDK